MARLPLARQMEDSSQMPDAMQTNRFVVAALYKFVVIEDCPALQAELKQLCQSHGIMGTLLIATEGLNGTISGTSADRSCYQMASCAS